VPVGRVGMIYINDIAYIRDIYPIFSIRLHTALL